MQLPGVPIDDTCLNADHGEAVRGDAERPRPGVIITPPDRQRTAGRDFFDKPAAQQPADGLFGSASLEIGRKFNRTLRVPCGGGQQHELRISELVR